VHVLLAEFVRSRYSHQMNMQMTQESFKISQKTVRGSHSFLPVASAQGSFNVRNTHLIKKIQTFISAEMQIHKALQVYILDITKIK